MAQLRIILVLIILSLLNGCLQVELVGPVVGAQVSIAKLRGGEVIVANLRTQEVEDTIAAAGQEQWGSLNFKSRLLLMAGVDVPDEALENSTLYLVTANGGTDMDFNGNRRQDTVGTRVDRTLHAIMTGSQLKKSGRVNMLTDAIYQDVRGQVDDLNNRQLRALLNDRAKRMVKDINGDGKATYKDILRWSNIQDSKRYKGPKVFLQRYSRSIADALYSSNVYEYDVANLVMGARWKPARKDGPYRDVLVGCASPVTVGDTCQLGTFPFLGMTHSSPSVEDIMNRVVVSHRWMAARFEEFLQQVPTDMLLMFRSVTSLVVDADTIPSFYEYWSSTIYLDGDFFWRTPSERKTITEEEDYRSEFASAVNFSDLWSYVDSQGEELPRFYEVGEDGKRALDQMVRLSASLMFHELAHAADEYRPAQLAQFRPWQIPSDNLNPSVSTELTQSSPLTATELLGVGGVLFQGAEPTAAEASYTAADIGRMFEPDGASDLYAYSSRWEDTAMLLEEAMMAIHFGLRRDVAFTSSPDGEGGHFCDDHIVGWGQRGRIAAPQVLARAQTVARQLIPDRGIAPRLNTLPGPVNMNVGVSWCDPELVSDRAAMSYRVAAQSKRTGRLPEPHPRPYR